MPEPGTVAAIVEQLRSRYPVTSELHLAFDGWPVGVVSNSAETVDCLASYYRRYRSDRVEWAAVVHVLDGEFDSSGLKFELEPPEPGKTKIKHAFCDFPDGRLIRKVETGMQFLIGAQGCVAVGPCRTRIAQVINFINTRFIDKHLHDGSLLCHAAGVAFRRRGLTMSGPSGTGKSTLAMHLMTHGVNFVSNDRVLLNRSNGGLRMLGVPKYPRINPGTILNNPNLRGMLTRKEVADLSSLPPGELWMLERKYDVWIDEVFGPDRLQLSAPFSALMLLGWKRAPGAVSMERINLRERLNLLPALMKTPGVFHPGLARDASPEDQAQRYVAALEDQHVYYLSGGGDFGPAIGACLELLEGSR